MTFGTAQCRIVVSQHSRITYEELDKKSDKLAEYLIQTGIKANNLVGLCAFVSVDFIIAMLGILKAGAVYFPLDPEYPRERREYMLRDANEIYSKVVDERLKGAYPQ